ncbi:ABC transporter substrate-binding protein [Anaerobacillus sp. MEB173]|uniref:ABC transporter substrate-binding protein n=1 Tax=Anaerobacillus sp. MEB173 TaxID=3383345 RepID=UPI003F8F0B98
MKVIKKFIAVPLLALMALAGCGSEETAQSTENAEQPANEAQEMVTIGTTQIVEHPSLDAAFEGFKAALADNGYVEGENVTFDVNNAQNDMNTNATIAQNLVNQNVDLIFANSTPSAQSVLNATREIPIIFTSVTDAVGAELVQAMDQPGDNITGVLDLHPESIEMTIDFISTFFPNSKVGLIYNSGEQNSIAQIEAVEAAIEGTSLAAVTRSVSTSAEVQQAAESLVGSADIFFIVTDNTVVSALESVIGVAEDQNIPLIVGEPDSLKRGGFATFGIDYFSIGYRSGEMAAEILNGDKTTADIPVEYPADMQLFINKAAADAQGVEWNSEWDNLAQLLEEE